VRISSKAGLVGLMLLLVTLPVMAACSSNNGETATVEQAGTTESEEEIVLIIGNLTDKSGPASNARKIIDMALEDVAKYYNNNNLIPGVELKIVSYDSMYDPSKHIPGYNPIKLSKMPSSIRTTAPEMGQHTEEVLLENGYFWDEMAHPKEGGIISAATRWSDIGYSIILLTFVRRLFVQFIDATLGHFCQMRIIG
jgi:hypothetical protein